MRKMALVFVFAALGSFGCDGTAGNPEDNALDVIDNAEKADGVIRPVGTYRNEAPTAGGFTAVVLKTDKTFRREVQVMCITTPCNPIATEGRYGWSKSGSTRYIRFLDENGDLIDRYAYTLSGDVLTLRVPNTTQKQKLTLSADAYCAVPADCELQDLAQPRCIGEWTCGAENTCAYECTTPCAAAGGTCVGLYPDACANGTVGDANTFSCGGGVGVQCCLPPTPVNACAAAGGTCVPLVPDACANGSVGDANTFSCGGGLGVQCCLPPTFNACQAAGGSCVALYPGACANGHVGDATQYSCGGGLGVECCLP
ncbi:MAG TPA: hypothetical protein VGQ83_25165 [Polyangia bacterium]|jgi:hypothetical protein